MHYKTWLVGLTLISLAVLAFPVSSAVRKESLDSPIIQESSVHTENFDNYTYKSYTNAAVWDKWNGTLRLRRLDALGQGLPSVAVDQDGNSIVVWSDRRDGRSQIYAQKLDPLGNRLWQDDIRINKDTSSAELHSPDIVIDQSNHAWVVWHRSENDVYDIYAQRIDAGGNHLWLSDIRINREPGAADQFTDPIAAMDSDQDLVTVWEDDRNDTPDIYAQKLGGQGNWLWDTDIKVNASASEYGWEHNPSLAIDSNDFIVISWDEGGDVFTQRLTAAGNRTWTEDIRVDTNNGIGYQCHPQVAVDKNGNAIIVWRDSRQDRLYDIYAQKLTATGEKSWSSDIKISPDDEASRTQTDPALALWDDNVVIVWRDGSDIFGQHLSGNGNKLWPNAMQIDIGTGISSSYPAIASDPDGNAIVTWKGYQNGNTDIYTRKITRHRTWLWHSAIRVNNDLGAASQRSPSVATDDQGNVFLAWQDYRKKNSEIYLQKVDENGNLLWESEIEASVDLGEADQRDPSMVIGNRGELFLVWEDYRNGDSDIYGQLFDPNGNRQWDSDLRVNSDATSLSQNSPALAIDGEEYVWVAWSDQRNSDSDVYVQRLNFDGSKFW